MDIEEYKARGKYYKKRKCPQHSSQLYTLGCADCREVFCALCVPAAIKPGSCVKSDLLLSMNHTSAHKYSSHFGKFSQKYHSNCLGRFPTYSVRVCGNLKTMFLNWCDHSRKPSSFTINKILFIYIDFCNRSKVVPSL